jgi:hypothetical protein
VADGSAAPGGRQFAGTWVDRRGAAKKLVSRVAGGEVGGAVGSFGRVGYLAAGENDLESVRAERGLMKLEVTDGVVPRAPRGGRSAAQRVVTSRGG